MRRTTNVTIRDVARTADVSIATVSRALSTPGLVAEPTRKRVIAAVRKLGYEPNRAARSLITGRTGLIGVVVPDLGNPFFLGLLKGVQTAARDLGHLVLLADTAEDAGTEAALIRPIARQVDGLVLLSSRLAGPVLRDATGSCRAVLVNRVLPGFPAVLLDGKDGMRQMLQHLAALGHRRCGYAGGPRESFADAERRRGLAKAGADNGVRLVDLGAFPPLHRSGARIADLAVAADVTALIAFNDLMALGVVARLRELGLRVPADLSVTGFDDIPMAALSAPGLTTIAAPLEEAGRNAVELLAQARESQDSGAPSGRLLPVRLVVRGSTGAPRRPGRRESES